MNKIALGNVLRLYLTAEDKKRIKKEFISLNPTGVEGDKYNGKENRSLLLTPQSSYKKALDNDINIKESELGENILVDFDCTALPVGTKLQIGETIIQISQKGTLCPGLSKIDNKLPKLLKEKRGIFAEILQTGTVKTGDCVYQIS